MRSSSNNNNNMSRHRCPHSHNWLVRQSFRPHPVHHLRLPSPTRMLHHLLRSVGQNHRCSPLRQWIRPEPLLNYFRKSAPLRNQLLMFRKKISEPWMPVLLRNASSKCVNFYLRNSEKASGLVRMIVSRSRCWMLLTLLRLNLLLNLLLPHGMLKMETAFLRIMRGWMFNVQFKVLIRFNIVFYTTVIYYHFECHMTCRSLHPFKC